MTQRMRMYLAKSGEVKFFDTTKTNTTVANTGTILNSSLVLIPQGITESTRIGRKIIVTALHINLVMLLPATVTANDASDSVRFIVYLDKQANGAAAGVTDILESAVFLSFNDLTNTGRFKILKTKNCSLSAQSGNGTSCAEEQKFFQLNMTNLKIPIEFNSTTGAITEITSNNIGVLAISQSGKVGAQYVARIRYIDG